MTAVFGRVKTESCVIRRDADRVGMRLAFGQRNSLNVAVWDSKRVDLAALEHAEPDDPSRIDLDAPRPVRAERRNVLVT